MRAGHNYKQSPGGWRLTLATTVVLLVLWLAGEGEGRGVGEEGGAGLLEERVKVQHPNSNSAGDKRNTPPVCIATHNTGVVPCDNDPRCCHPDGKRVNGTNYCCPPGAYLYSFKSGNDDICACAINPSPSEL